MLKDALDRPAQDLRISVTDRCNYRCSYCMPQDQYDRVSRSEILSFEEIERLARIFISLGMNGVRLTGGEPLLRRDLARLVARLSGLPGLQDLSLTTNGSLLKEQAPLLAAAGLKRINVSIDTLDPDKFKRVTKRGDLSRVLDGLFAAKHHGLHPVKINTVIERGFNDDEIPDLVDFARLYGFSIRFIEFMDVGNANNWSLDRTVPKQEILARIGAHRPLKESGRAGGTAPAVEYQFEDGKGDMGVIASVTEPFCSTCTRARLTADGKLVTCLFSHSGHDLKHLLRGGATDAEIHQHVCDVWLNRRDRYSEERLAALNSREGYQGAGHRKIEMIRLGG
jgi:cyclic pyranopterin phosphate synthase